MRQDEQTRKATDDGLAHGSAPPDASRLRVVTLRPGEVWPERETCELVLVLSCRTAGFKLEALPDALVTGELALLPKGNGLIASAQGQVLSARLDSVPAPSEPERLRDRLVEQLMRRAWASAHTCGEVIEPTLRLIEVLADLRMRARQERLAFLEGLDPRLASTIDYIDAHLGSQLSVEKLARVAHLSPGHLSRCFKAATGLSVWAYVRQRRCERARELLLETTLGTAEIAYRCGFSSQAHLTTTLKAHLGETPGAVRNAASGQAS